jgi:isopenicillin-N N-acyltransferase-like protein
MRPHLAMYEALAPHVVEEMEGLARGADVSFDEIALINVRDELMVAARGMGGEACTSFGCSGDVALDGKPILGQSKDTAAVSADLYVVVAMYQQGRPDILQMPYAGELGVFGLSSSGMSCFGNSLYVRGRNGGDLPFELARRLALEAESIDALLALVNKHGVGTPGNLTIGDASGRTIALEVTDHGHAVVEATDGILVHTNHILSHLSGYEVYDEPERGGSQRRLARMSELLAVERGRLTAPLAMGCFSDHANYPRSICRHASFPGDIQTTAALVVEPAALRMHIVRGQPCCGWSKTYTL